MRDYPQIAPKEEVKRAIDLDALLKPRSIALVGASTDASKLGGKPLRFLRHYGYEGRLYPVNPNYSEVAGLRCYPNLSALPEKVDLAIITVPTSAIVSTIKECSANGIKSATIFTAGFAEVGEQGRRLQEELRAAALEGELALVGPNCAGFVSVREKVTATFSVAMERGQLLPGPVAIVSQSGFMGTCVFAAAQESGIGVSYWISTGNEATLGVSDFMSYLVDDQNTKVIVVYIEESRDSEALRESALKALKSDKPVIAIKVGASQAGARAAVSHTGSLVGSDGAYDAFFAQHGIIRARDMENIFDLASMAIAGRRPKGRGVALMTASGGAGIFMCDRCEEAGLDVVSLRAETVEALRQFLPSFASFANPVDFTAELVTRPGLLKRALEIVVGDPGVDSLVIFLALFPSIGATLARDIAEVAAKTDKPVIVNWMAPPPEAVAILRENQIPMFSDPARGVRALRELERYVERRERCLVREAVLREKRGLAGAASPRQKKAREIIQRARQQGRKILTEEEAKLILDLYDIPTPRRRLVQDGQAAQAARELGFPVAVKISSADIAHKSQAGGVRLGLKNAEEVTQACRDITTSVTAHYPQASLQGILVEEMISGGLEVILGFKQDPRLGPGIMFGLGGIFVELLEDVSLRVGPLDEEEALAMIKEIRGYPLLTGYGGQQPRDLAALSRALVGVSDIAEELKDDVAELDINPILVLPVGNGVRAADAMMILK